MKRKRGLAIAIGAAVLGVAVVGVAVELRQAAPSAAVESPAIGPIVNAPVLHTASTHLMQYYVSLPTGWSKSRLWPVVVAITGSDKDWLASANGFAAVRDAQHYPFIVITPVVLTIGGRDLRRNPRYSYTPDVWDRVDRDGRCEFDREGIRAAVDDVVKEYGGEPKVFMTGFSGGGHPVLAYTFIHPDRLRAVALTGTNYIGRCVRTPTRPTNPEVPEPVEAPPVSTAPERLALPIRFLIGAADPNSANAIAQGDRAIADLKLYLFGNVSTETVPKLRHEPMVAQVLEYFASMLATGER